MVEEQNDEIRTVPTTNMTNETTDEPDAMTCDQAKQEILRLLDERQLLEQKILNEFDKDAYRYKKKVDKDIRKLFEEYAVCNIEEGAPVEPDSSDTSPTGG